MNMSLTPILLAGELGFLYVLAWRTARVEPVAGRMNPVYAYFLWVTAYGVITSVLGARGVYISEKVLALLPGFWLQLVTVAVVVLPVVMFSYVRDGLRRIADVTPWHWFAYFHGLRVLALGTAYKTFIRQFPLSFELIVGLPDLLFGLSALWVASKAKQGKISESGFMIWNVIGALVIVPAAPVVLQLGLPGPVQVFADVPDARSIFTYPMSIAPMIGVPLFVLVNLWVAWRLWERHTSVTV